MQICAKNVRGDNSLKVGPDDATEEECVGAEGRKELWPLSLLLLFSMIQAH